MVIVVCVILVLIIAIIFVSTYNKLVTKIRNVERNKSLIDVFLKKRFDLIPNLVEVCKGHVKFEQETLTRLVELRSLFNNNPNEANEKNLRTEYQRLIGVIENYPDLKSSQSFLELQKQIVDVEDELQATRRMYINSITDYNNTVLRIPTSLFAGMMGYRTLELPKFDYGEIKIEF